MKEAMLTSKLRPKNKKGRIIISLTTFFLLFHLSLLSSFLIRDSFADTVSNGNYSVDVNTIDTNPQPTPKSQVLGATNINTKDFTTGPNYTVNSSTNSLSEGLSQNIIDFGILSSTNPVIRTSKIFIDAGQSGGQIVTYENHPLLSSTNDVLPNTTCDNGACSADIAAFWNNTLTYGFGYRCDSTQQNVCDPQFYNQNYFKQYAQLSPTQTSATTLISNNGKAQASITYKVNISGTQKTGGYYNSITYLAIPNF